MATYKDLLLGAQRSGSDHDAPVDPASVVWDPLPLVDKQAILSTFWKGLAWGDAPLKSRKAMGLEPIPDTIPDDQKPSFTGGWWDPLVLGREIIGRLIRYEASQNPEEFRQALREGKLRSWLVSHLPRMQSRFIQTEIPHLRKLAEQEMDELMKATIHLQEALREAEITSPIRLAGMSSKPKAKSEPEPFQSRGVIDEPESRWALIVDQWVKPYFLPHARPKVEQLLASYLREAIGTRSHAMTWAVKDAIKRMASFIKPSDVTSEGRYFLLALWPEEYSHLR